MPNNTSLGRGNNATSYGANAKPDIDAEWNALASYPLGKRFTLTAKLARYEADGFATDTTKLWFQIETKL